jgi:hypothetical protein
MMAQYTENSKITFPPFFSTGRQRKKVGKAFKKNSCTVSTPKKNSDKASNSKKFLQGKSPPPGYLMVHPYKAKVILTHAMISFNCEFL